MKKAIGFFSICIIYSSFSYGQQWLWGKGGTGTPLSTFGDVWLTATDNSGDVYLAGNNPVGIVKYNGSGIFQWSCIPPPDIISLCCDKWNNLYILGDINSYDMPFRIGSYNFTTLDVDMILLKYNSSGNLIWATSSKVASSHSLVGWYSYTYNSICTDTSGNIFVTGFFNDTVNFGSKQIITSAIWNPFVVKYDSGGHSIWAKSATVKANVYGGQGLSISTDNPGNIYVSGLLKDTIVFGDDSITGVSFLAKYDANGNIIWAKGLQCKINEMCADTKGNCYITGGFNGNLTLGTYNFSFSGLSDYFLARFNTDGNILWAKSGNPSENTNLARFNASSVVTDYCGNVFMSVGGESSASLFSLITDTVYIGTQKVVVKVTGTDPVFVLQYDSSGILLCYTNLTSGGDDMSSVVSDNLGNVFLGGDFVRPQLIIGQDTLADDSYPGEYGFIAKWHVCNGEPCKIIEAPQSSQNESSCIFIPTAFSPNVEYNNILYVRGPCIATMDFIVFDRWGNKVFESQNLNKGWDGTYNGIPLNMGTYVWYLNSTLQDGTNVKKKGNVTLVR